MSDRRYHCGTPRRLQLIREQAAINGLDYLEIASVDQRVLRVVFAHPLPGEPGEIPSAPPTLVAGNFRIDGGERTRGIRVEDLTVNGNEALVTVDKAGDFSTYKLSLVADATLPDSLPPPGFDPWLASIDFSFKVECPSDFDCAQPVVCDEAALAEPELNYLAKDYESFRRLLLDRMALLMPDWQDRSPADVQVTLVELLAYLGDQLSQYQDAVTGETYLLTSRLRRSVARHVRPLDYHLHEGVNARCFVHVAVTPASAADGATLPAASKLFTALIGKPPAFDPAELDDALAQRPTVFETMTDLVLRSEQNSIPLHTWSDADCCLPKGATRAWLLNTPDRGLAAGDLLAFEEIASPETGLAQDADPARRHVVRLTGTRLLRDDLEGVDVLEVDWDRADALPFPLCVSTEVLAVDGTPQVVQTGLARGNLVPADHGLSLGGIALNPPTPSADRVYEPQLPRLSLVFHEPFEPGAAVDAPAADLLLQDARTALPAITLSDGTETWFPKLDLLRSGRFDPHFVVEPERDGSLHLRFGNGRYGKEPPTGTALVAELRQGGGPAGNIGAEALQHVASLLDGIDGLRNVLPASGGLAEESLQEAKAFAPYAYRQQRRAVIAEDYAAVAEEDADVQQATAEHRWFGSWYTVVVIVDGREGRLVSEDATFRQRLLDRLETRRMAGVDLQLRDPLFLNLDLYLTACARPDVFNADVREALIDRFSSGRRRDGQLGFFHPDNMTFGKALYLSEILAAAMEVDGVVSVEIGHLRPWGQEGVSYLPAGIVEPGQGEVLRLENNPSLPEHGVFDCEVQGGL
ncbi:putative baseplate assembly protein [Pelagibius sp.]|uniref:putative baseplate assembly protein n=1 Tax=Pelagibius sp. TaxID=1931238 RepID=UPI00260F34EC|nr:putative baseplate assembly protein [Pelagibius sp.]